MSEVWGHALTSFVTLLVGTALWVTIRLGSWLKGEAREDHRLASSQWEGLYNRLECRIRELEAQLREDRDLCDRRLSELAQKYEQEVGQLRQERDSFAAENHEIRAAIKSLRSRIRAMEAGREVAPDDEGEAPV
jgi:hypothetical protein